MRLNLLTKIALALTAVGLLPLALAAWPLVRLNLDAMRDQVLRANVVAARSASARVGDRIASWRALAVAEAQSPAFDSGVTADASAHLAALLSAPGDLIAVALIAPTGQEVVRAQRPERSGETARALAVAAGRAGGDAVRAVRLGDDLWLAVEADLPESRGALRLLFDGAALERAVEQEITGEQASLALLDRDGAVLAGAPLTVDDLPDALTNAQSGRLVGAGVFVTRGGDEVLAAYDAVAGTSWAVLSRQPAAVAEQVAGRMIRGAATAVGAALLLTAGLSVLGYVSVVRPVRQLSRVQRQLAGVAPRATSGDEIRDLRESFSLLEQRVHDREALQRVFLGRYQVLGVLGQGAMGMVFEGWDPRLERSVALKTVRPLSEAGLGVARRTAAARLVREAITAAGLNHPNLVAVYDAAEAGDVAFIAMELVRGSSLDRYLWRRRHLQPAAAAHVGAAVAGALAAAHAGGVIHQDVKPGNVLLGLDGSIKVTDFGIARVVSALAGDEDTVFGTPGYVPPETLEGRGYGEAGDLFSLGVVLYECLIGSRPFTGATVQRVVRATIEAAVIPPHLLSPRVPPALGELVAQLLAKSPSERPAGAAEVAERLARIAASLGAVWAPDLGGGDVEETDETMEEIDGTLTSRMLPTTLRFDRGAGARRRASGGRGGA